MKNSEEFNEQLQVTWKIAGRIWLACAWRLIILFYILFFMFKSLFIPPSVVPPISHLINLIFTFLINEPVMKVLFLVISLAICIVASIDILKRVLTKYYTRMNPSFRVLIVKSEPSEIEKLGLDKDEKSLTHDEKVLKKQLSDTIQVPEPDEKAREKTLKAAVKEFHRHQKAEEKKSKDFPGSGI